MKLQRKSVRAAAKENPISVLLVHRFYEPDVTTYSQMLAMIADHLRADGFRVDVFTTQPGYNGIYDGPDLPKKRLEDGVSVHRAPIPGGSTSIGRLVGGLIFGALLILRSALPSRRYDVVMVSTVPPVLMGLCGLAAARLTGANLVYHCMDLYPEIAIASGHAPPGIVARVARAIDSRTIARSAKTVVLSEDMRQTIAARGAPVENTHVQNNFTIDSFEPDVSPRVGLPVDLQPTDRFRLLFAGNVGRFQGLPELIAGFALDRERSESADTELVFLGAGAAREQLRQQAEHLGITNFVRFVDHQPLEVAMEAMKAADLAVVSLGPELIRSAYPSKTVMYLEMGCRILAIVEEDSELANLVADNRLGTTAQPGDVEAIADAIQNERERLVCEGDGERARTLASRHFAAETVLPQWSDLMRSIGQDR